VRGWSVAEAHNKAKENKKSNLVSVYSQQTWLARINPDTGVYYTIEQADFERNSRRPIRKEYWIKKGYSQEESEKLAIETKNHNNKKGARIGIEDDIRRATSKRCVEYYTSRGYTHEESLVMVAKSQIKFSKDICVQKYGQDKGEEIWRDRQDRWQATLNAKTSLEKARINRLKLTKGITVSRIEKLILEHIKTTIPNVIHQFTLNYLDKKQYIYDIMANKKIIEYNGDFWHANPKMYSSDFINPRSKIKAVDKWASDHEKIQYARTAGYEVLVIWESDFKKNEKEVLEQCIQFLTC